MGSSSKSSSSQTSQEYSNSYNTILTSTLNQTGNTGGLNLAFSNAGSAPTNLSTGDITYKQNSDNTNQSFNLGANSSGGISAGGVAQGSGTDTTTLAIYVLLGIAVLFAIKQLGIGK